MTHKSTNIWYARTICNAYGRWCRTRCHLHYSKNYFMNIHHSVKELFIAQVLMSIKMKVKISESFCIEASVLTSLYEHSYQTKKILSSIKNKVKTKLTKAFYPELMKSLLSCIAFQWFNSTEVNWRCHQILHINRKKFNLIRWQLRNKKAKPLINYTIV